MIEKHPELTFYFKLQEIKIYNNQQKSFVYDFISIHYKKQ